MCTTSVKNIVGVVLACNNFEIIDLGVMVPPQKILETAKKEEINIIGLSGLITPSLDEMIFIAREMERQQFDFPLMIGGASTSRRAHTAVKIFPEYSGVVVHVNDASRSVPVAQTLSKTETLKIFQSKIEGEYTKLREDYLSRRVDREYLTIEDATKNALQIDFKASDIFEPNFIGTKVFKNISLKKISYYIDWTPFFITWELRGKFPRIMEDKVIGK